MISNLKQPIFNIIKRAMGVPFFGPVYLLSKFCFSHESNIYGNINRVVLQLFGKMDIHHMSIAGESPCFGKIHMIGGIFVVIGMVQSVYQKVKSYISFSTSDFFTFYIIRITLEYYSVASLGII